MELEIYVSNYLTKLNTIYKNKPNKLCYQLVRPEELFLPGSSDSVITLQFGTNGNLS